MVESARVKSERPEALAIGDPPPSTAPSLRAAHVGKASDSVIPLCSSAKHWDPHPVRESVFPFTNFRPGQRFIFDGLLYIAPAGMEGGLRSINQRFGRAGLDGPPSDRVRCYSPADVTGHKSAAPWRNGAAARRHRGARWLRCRFDLGYLPRW